MVKIAIAGGSGEVAREIVDALAATKKHEVILLTRKDVSSLPLVSDTNWFQVDYSDKYELKERLSGVELVMSFITPQTDPRSEAQKNLIDASILAGVKRFAPSEWATSSFEHMDWYAGKVVIRDYLKAVNNNDEVLEYTLFQPGLFLNYFTHPHKSATHVNTFQTQFDFENRRAIVSDGSEGAKITLTASQDLANIVVRAVEYQGKWPVNGGIKGCEISITQLLELMEDIRGGPITVEKLNVDDLKAGLVKSTWLPKVNHPAIPPEQADALAGMFLAGMSLGISCGALNVSDDFNQLFPDYRFVQPREFLSAVWKGKL